MGNRDRDLDIMTRTILGEAGGEDAYGQVMVGNVLMNRSRDSRWGGSVADVALAPNQFSAWNKGAGGNNPGKYSPDSPEYKRTYKLSQMVYDGQIDDRTDGATHYYSPVGMKALDQGYDVPKWMQDETDRRGADPITYGGHVFTGRTEAPVLNVSTKNAPEPPVTKPAVNPYMPIQQEVIPTVANDPPKEYTGGSAEYQAEVKKRKAEERAKAVLAARGATAVPVMPLPVNSKLQVYGPGVGAPQNMEELYKLGVIPRRYVGDTPDYLTGDQVLASQPALNQSNVAPPQQTQTPPGQQPMDLGQFKNMANFAIGNNTVDPVKPDWYFDASNPVGSGGGQGGQGGDPAVNVSLSTANGQPQPKKPWLNQDRSQMLLSIGAGLLSGDDWASGVGAAATNLQGVTAGMQDRQDTLTAVERQKQDQIDLIRMRPEDMNSDRTQPIKQMKMRDGSIAGVIQKGMQFVLPDGTDVSESVIGPVNNGDAFGSKTQPSSKWVSDEQGWLTSQVNTINALDSMDATLKDSRFGADGVMRNLDATLKTLRGKGLTDEQIRQAVINGDQQTILGGLRESVLGPGPMTEVDAGRLLMSMGGEIDSYLTNPDSVRARLGILKENSLNTYNVRANQYEQYRTQFPQLGMQPVPRYTPPAPPADTGALSSDNVGTGEAAKYGFTDEEWATLTDEEKASLK